MKSFGTIFGVSVLAVHSTGKASPESRFETRTLVNIDQNAGHPPRKMAFFSLNSERRSITTLRGQRRSAVAERSYS